MVEKNEFEESLSRVGGQTFLIRVLFRQNATLQGEIVWFEGEKTMHFRSFLEMTALMQEALELSGVPTAEYALKSWQGADAAEKQS